MTKYTEFIRQWAAKHDKSYMCAATDPRAREEYYGANPKPQKKSRLKAMREKAKEVIPEPERNSDLARAQEAMKNPAAGVLTNPDLLRLITSFTPKEKDVRKRLNNELNNLADSMNEAMSTNSDFYDFIADNYTRQTIIDSLTTFQNASGANIYIAEAPSRADGENAAEVLNTNIGNNLLEQGLNELTNLDDNDEIDIKPARALIDYFEWVNKFIRKLEDKYNEKTATANKKAALANKIAKWKTDKYPHVWDENKDLTVYGITKQGDLLIVFEKLSDPRGIVWKETGDFISFRHDDHWNDEEQAYAEKIGINKYVQQYNRLFNDAYNRASDKDLSGESFRVEMDKTFNDDSRSALVKKYFL